MIDVGPCYKCKCSVWIPDALYEAAQHGRGQVKFYCAYGHPMVFVVGESEETKLRRERDRLLQRLAEKDDDIAAAHRRTEHVEASLRTTKGHITRIKKRVGAGG